MSTFLRPGLRKVTAPPPPAGTTSPVSEYLVSLRVQILPDFENTRLSCDFPPTFYGYSWVATFQFAK